jgi:hypothetical protein
MVQRRNRTRLSFESPQPFSVARQPFRQNFNRHIAAQPDIGCPVNFSHATRAERGDNFIRPDFCAGSERHGVAQLYSVLRFAPPDAHCSPSVMLSGAEESRSDAFAQSKHPCPIHGPFGRRPIPRIKFSQIHLAAATLTSRGLSPGISRMDGASLACTFSEVPGANR